MVQFTDNTMRVYGPDNFPGSVLADVGVDRPAAQRFTDKPYVEIGTTDGGPGELPRLLRRRRRHRLRLLRLTGRQGPRRRGDGQRRVAEAVRQQDNRVFVVNNEVWQTGEGIVAARGMLADLRWVNAPDQLTSTR